MDVQTLTVIITGISIVIGIIVFILSRRQELETRQAALFMQVHSRWNSRDFTKAYGAVRYKDSEEEWMDTIQRVFEDPNRKNPDIDLDDFADHQMLSTFFEGLGILVKKDLVDLSLVEDLFAGRIIWYYETQVKPIAEEARKHLRDTTLYDSIEYLYNSMKQR
jgi:hypothetical protein